MSGIVASLLADRTPRPPLHPRGRWRDEATAEIDALDVPIITRAALHLLNDDLDRAHGIVQDREGEGLSNVIHAILHRREGDGWNSKYWWARSPANTIKALHGGRKQAEEFVDEVECASGARGVDPDELLDRQWVELTALARLALGDAAK